MHLSFRQKAMRITIWICALILTVRALTLDSSVVLPAFTLLVGAFGIELLLIFARRQIEAPMVAQP
jgi:hypothetical protein